MYDIVDSWNQPDDDALYKNDKQARDFLKKWNEIDADAYIFPTKTWKWF